MTDNEIIEGLRYCGKIDNCLQCGKCPYFRKVDCIKKNTNDTLDLINRQQAEIERLQMVIDKIVDHINPLPFETDYDEAIRKAKAEAIKEFAERLKKEKFKINYCGSVYSVIDVDEIDNLVAEMVGDNNAE